LWEALSTKDRQKWDDDAAKEKERYMAKKVAYNRLWYVPYKRAKKDPAAPKRNPSAFLLFAQGKRQELKKLNPGTKNTDISRMLGELWRNMPAKKKRHHVEREVVEREQYKIAIAEWRKQRETIQLAGKVGGTTSNPVSAIESGIGRNEQPTILKYGVTASVHGGCDDTYDFYPHVSDDPITGKDNCDVSIYPSHTMWHGPPQHHRQNHMHPERPPQVRHIHDCTQHFYPLVPRHYPRKHYRSLRPQENGNNIVNVRYFNPIPFPNKYGPPYVEQNNKEQEGNVTHHQDHYQKQHHQHASDQLIGRYASCEHSGETNQQYVHDETKQVNSNMDHFYYQHQSHYTQDDMKQEYDNLGGQRLNQQPGQHDIDQDMPHNMLLGHMDNTHQHYVSLRYGEGFVSPLNMHSDGE